MSQGGYSLDANEVRFHISTIVSVLSTTASDSDHETRREGRVQWNLFEGGGARQGSGNSTQEARGRTRTAGIGGNNSEAYGLQLERERMIRVSFLKCKHSI